MTYVTKSAKSCIVRVRVNYMFDLPIVLSRAEDLMQQVDMKDFTNRS